MGKRVDLLGQRFGRLVVERFAGTDKHNRAMWECWCECGKTHIAAGATMRIGRTKSCGCLWAEKNIGITRDRTGRHSKLYAVWGAILKRCCKPSCKHYANYGGRGISVCAEWLIYANFHAWALGSGYEEGLTIERIDNDGNYEPENCTWIPRAQQSRNRRNNRYITFRGQTKTVTDWARLMGIDPKLVRGRVDRYGWAVDRALTTPVKTKQEAI